LRRRCRFFFFFDYFDCLYLISSSSSSSRLNSSHQQQQQQQLHKEVGEKGSPVTPHYFLPSAGTMNATEGTTSPPPRSSAFHINMRENPVYFGGGDFGIFSNPETAGLVSPEQALEDLGHVARSVREASGVKVEISQWQFINE
jgi:hypothetical protein